MSFVTFITKSSNRYHNNSPFAIDESFLVNEAEEQSDEDANEPDAETVTGNTVDTAMDKLKEMISYSKKNSLKFRFISTTKILVIGG